MNSISVDLHLHTVLSPCGDLLMTPQNIIEQALKVGLDLIAITDHNSAENIEIALKLAQSTSLNIIPGMEVETTEEVHLLCLFDRLDQILNWQQVVYNALPNFKNDEDLFGPQLVTDLDDNFVKRVDKLLATATSLTVNQVINEVNNRGGIVIPSHINKPNYSLLANLGFIPDELDICGLEVSDEQVIKKVREQFKIGNEYNFIVNSDAHYLSDMTKGMVLQLEDINVTEICKAIKDKNN